MKKVSDALTPEGSPFRLAQDVVHRTGVRGTVCHVSPTNIVVRVPPDVASCTPAYSIHGRPSDFTAAEGE